MSTHDEQPREFTRGASGRLQGRARHPRDLTQGALQPPEHLQRSLRRPIRLQRVQAREAGRRGSHLGKLGVVLHRTGSEGIDPGVDAVVHLRQARVVPDQIPLRDLRESGGLPATMLLRDLERLDVQLGEAPCRSPRSREIPNGPLSERPLASDGCAQAHETRTSPIAPASASISSFVRRSVTATISVASSTQGAGTPARNPRSMRASRTSVAAFGRRTANSLKKAAPGKAASTPARPVIAWNAYEALAAH